MEDVSATTPVAPVTPVKKKGGLKKIAVIGLGAVLVLGVAAGGFWWLNRPTVAAAEPSIAERGLVTFDVFLVNLADAGGTRFLKVNVQLVVGSAEQAKHIQETPVVLMHVRSGILEVLTQQSASALVTADGKAALKTAIKERASALLHEQKVVDVLFSEFVVQF